MRPDLRATSVGGIVYLGCRRVLASCEMSKRKDVRKPGKYFCHASETPCLLLSPGANSTTGLLMTAGEVPARTHAIPASLAVERVDEWLKRPCVNTGCALRYGRSHVRARESSCAESVSSCLSSSTPSSPVRFLRLSAIMGVCLKYKKPIDSH